LGAGDITSHHSLGGPRTRWTWAALSKDGRGGGGGVIRNSTWGRWGFPGGLVLCELEEEDLSHQHAIAPPTSSCPPPPERNGLRTRHRGREYGGGTVRSQSAEHRRGAPGEQTPRGRSPNREPESITPGFLRVTPAMQVGGKRVGAVDNNPQRVVPHARGGHSTPAP
jgi:hypothetical protein